MKKSATAREARSEKTTVRPRSPNICPAIPSTKTIGKKTAIVVSVDATTAEPTSAVPRTVARIRSSPSSRQRWIDSRTTIELSTNIPIPRASPPSDMMLSETPARFSGAKVISTEIGIATATISVVLKLRRKRKRTITASRPPESAVCRTSSMLDSMKRERSEMSRRSAPYSFCSRGPRVLSIRSLARWAMSTMLASASL